MENLADKNGISLDEYRKLILEKHLPWIINYTIAFPLLYRGYKRRSDEELSSIGIEKPLEDRINQSVLIASATGLRNLLHFLGRGRRGDGLDGYKPTRTNCRKDEPFIEDFGLSILEINKLTLDEQETLKKAYMASINLLHFNWEHKNESLDSTQIIHDGALLAVKLVKSEVYDRLNYDFQKNTGLTAEEIAFVEGKGNCGTNRLVQ